MLHELSLQEYDILISLCFTEWNPSGQRQPGSRCDWMFHGSSGSISSPDHWLPAGTQCRYLFDVTSGAYLEFIVNIYGLRYVATAEPVVYLVYRVIYM